MNNDKSFLSKKYYYNSDGNLLKVETLDKGGWINYTESKKYDTISNSITNYLENEDCVKELDVYFYNTKNQIIKRENPADRSILTGRNATVEYNYFKYQDEYSYNPDGTLFEWKRMIGGTKTQMSRFRYFKKDIQ